MKSQHCWEITDRLPKINDNDLLETFGKDFFFKGATCWAHRTSSAVLTEWELVVELNSGGETSSPKTRF